MRVAPIRRQKMKLISKQQTFINDKKESITYSQIYLVAQIGDNLIKVPIKATFKNDNKVLIALVSKED